MNNSIEYRLNKILMHLEKQLQPMVTFSDKEQYAHALQLVRQAVNDLNEVSRQPESDVLKGLL